MTVVTESRLLAEEGLQNPGAEDGHQVADLVETKRAGQAADAAETGLASTLDAMGQQSEATNDSARRRTYLKANQYRRALIRARKDSFLFQIRTSPVTPASLLLLNRSAMRLVTAAKEYMSEAHEQHEDDRHTLLVNKRVAVSREHGVLRSEYVRADDEGRKHGVTLVTVGPVTAC